MFLVNVEKVITNVQRKEEMTSGSVNTYTVAFEFTEHWDGATRTAVFRSNKKGPIHVLLNDDNECNIPWEILTDAGAKIEVGVYGTVGDNMVIPTTWASLGTVLLGVTTGAPPKDPTPSVYQQILTMISNGGGGDGGNYNNILAGHGIDINPTVEGKVVSVVTTNNFTGDNTLPMSAAGVQSALGNVEMLLAAI